LENKKGCETFRVPQPFFFMQAVWLINEKRYPQLPAIARQPFVRWQKVLAWLGAAC